MFESRGWECAHWSTVGDHGARDRAVMDWAKRHGYILFTHDLDFGALLAAHQATGPSVIQVRSHDVLPESLGSLVVRVIEEYESELDEGSIITIDEARTRVRMLPIRAADS